MPNVINRRAWLRAAAAIVPTVKVGAQTGSAGMWGGSVIDCHFHLRRTPEANAVHLDGCGVSHALVLARESSADDMKALQARYPGRFPAWMAGADAAKPEAADLLSAAVKKGAMGLGEIKSHVESAGPEMRRLYTLASELDVPILMHFQEVPHTPTEGVFNTGFRNFELILKAYPKTRFIGHGDAFWANISLDYANESAYPDGEIKRGGVTDKLLGDYPNLFADLSANSGNNALSRDPEFTPGFLKRHREKLIFGSDCACTDGKGGGVSQGGNPGASRMAGKCVARETLTLLQKNVSPAEFHKLTWENAHRIYRLNG